MTPINPKNPPPPPGDDDPKESSSSPGGDTNMKPERVQHERYALTEALLRKERLDVSWEIVDGGIERRYWIPGGFGVVIDFFDEVNGKRFPLAKDPIVMVDGDAVTLRLEGENGRLDGDDFEVARVIDERTFYSM